MISDTLDNLSLYTGLSDHFRKAIDYIQSVDLCQLPEGKLRIVGDDIFASVSEYVSKPAAEVKWESHITYADIQIILEGEEKIGFTPVDSMKVSEVYDAGRDILFYSGQGDYITMKPGKFAIFLPGDAHQPCVVLNSPVHVRKIVFKVRI